MATESGEVADFATTEENMAGQNNDHFYDTRGRSRARCPRDELRDQMPPVRNKET